MGIKIRKEVIIDVSERDIREKFCESCPFKQFYGTVRKQTEFMKPMVRKKPLPEKKLKKDYKHVLNFIRAKIKEKTINRQTFFTAMGKNYLRVPTLENQRLGKVFSMLVKYGYLKRLGRTKRIIAGKQVVLTNYELIKKK